MAKTIFGTTEKSNFILNMDLDWYRRGCGKLMLGMLWAVAASQAINQMTYSVNAKFSDMISAGGFGGLIALFCVSLRSVATVFSVAGVLAMIMTVIGLMRGQVTKPAAVPYLLLTASLGWGIASLCHSYDIKTSFFGQDGRDEGWLALLVYAAVFWLGSMLRRKPQQETFLRGVLIFGIAQSLFGILQAVFGFASQYVMVEPLLYQKLKLPSGMTDSPITFAMLLGMILAVSVPAAMLSQEKKTRILALICAGLSMLMCFKTQAIAGLTAGIGAVVFAVLIWVLCKKQAAGKAWIMPAVVLCCAAISIAWAWFSPSLNGTYNTASDQLLENGYHLYDGGVIWDDGHYRLSTAGQCTKTTDDAPDFYNAGDVWRFCQKQGIKAVKIDPLFGVGPDNFYFTQLHSSMSVEVNLNALDKPYNDLLYLTATRGIPSLLLHLVLLGFCFVQAWKRRKDGWPVLAACGGAVIYTAASVTGISVLTVAPLFWMLLGMLTAEPIIDAPKPEKVSHRKKPKRRKK